MPRTNAILLLLTAALALLCCRADVLRGRVLRYALRRVERSALEPVQTDKLLSGMLDGMLRSVGDLPYSAFIPPEVEGAYEEAIQGRNVGIGIWLLGLQSKELPVLWFVPMHDSPVEDAHLRFGDRIAGVDGKGFAGMSVQQVVDLLAGADGSEVVLSVIDRQSLLDEEPAPPSEEDTSGGENATEEDSSKEDDSKEDSSKEGDSDDGGLSDLKARYGSLMREVTVRRAVIQQDIVLGDRRDEKGNWDFTLEGHPNIGYVKIDQFTDATGPDFAAALGALDGRIEALILDLRGNPGGFLPAAVMVSNMFLNQGDLIVTTRERGGKVRGEFKAEGGQKYLWPMVVLIDGGSASASEIVSAALSDHQRAALIGHRSYGKGTVQQLFKLPCGMGTIRLTEASFWRPSGEPIHRRRDAAPEDQWGVTPDTTVGVSTKGYLAAGLYRRVRSLEEYAERGSLLMRLAERRLAEDIEQQEACCEIFEDQVDEDAPMGKAPFFDPVIDAAVEHLEKLLAERPAAAPEL